MVEGIITILLSDPDVRGAVGLNKAGDKYKVYPVWAAQPEEIPYITVRVAGRAPNYCKGSQPDSYNYQYLARSFAKSYERVLAIDRAIENCLSNRSETVFGSRYMSIQLVSTVDRDEMYAEGTYVRDSLYRAIVYEATIT
jgi:hypothetical protein